MMNLKNPVVLVRNCLLEHSRKSLRCTQAKEEIYFKDKWFHLNPKAIHAFGPSCGIKTNNWKTFKKQVVLRFLFLSGATQVPVCASLWSWTSLFFLPLRSWGIRCPPSHRPPKCHPSSRMNTDYPFTVTIPNSQSKFKLGEVSIPCPASYGRGTETQSINMLILVFL